MRNGGDITNQRDLETCALQRPDGRFPACTSTANHDFDLAHSLIHSAAGRTIRSGLGGKGVPFLAPLKPLEPAEAQEMASPD